MKTLKWITIVSVVLVILGAGVLLWHSVNAPELFRKFGLSSSRVVSHSVSLTSDTASISAEITNMKWLSERLIDTNFWSKDRVVFFEKSGFPRKKITASSLEIHLTDKAQSLGQTVSTLPDGSAYMYQAYGMEYDVADSRLKLYLFVDPEIIRNESADNLTKRFSGIFWSTIFDITHPFLPEHISFEERLIGKPEFMKDHLKFPDNLFMSVKKR